MEFVKASLADLPAVLHVFAIAREHMKAAGNPNQWKDDRPVPGSVQKDIENGCLYVQKDETGIHGVFALVPGIDPTYQIIEEGAWLNNSPYLAIHKVATDGTIHGFFTKIVAFSEKQGLDLRIDTHKDNASMNHLIQKNGFSFCGIIYTDDGTKRLAYQKPAASCLITGESF